MKSEVVQIRLTKEEKQLFKEVAKELGISMSELMIVATENKVKTYKEKVSLQKNVVDRAMKTDKKLSEIKDKMREKREYKKSSKSKKFVLKFFTTMNLTVKKLIED